MRCPYCACEQDKVVDSRSSKEGRAVRRRRECLECAKRFTTYEYVEDFPIIIVKGDKRREPFDRQKLLNGIITACKKRPVSTKKVESIVDKIKEELEKEGKSEIQSKEIGQKVMDELYSLDEVAYVRFASVYRKFKDSAAFLSEIKELNEKTASRS